MAANDGHTNLAIRVPERTRTASPYVAGMPIDELARELGLDPATIVKLASNENPLGMSPKAAAAAAALASSELARYPDANGFALKRAIAAHHGIASDTITLGNGSENVIEIVTKAFVEPGTSAVSSQYAFIVFAQSVHNFGGESIVVPAKDLAPDLDAMLAAIRPDTVAVYLANPNNPTGTFVEPSRMADFLAAVPAHVVVVLDEAYNEYLPPQLRHDGTQYPARFPNVVVTRTFSKVYGLAGLRVGYGVSSPEITEYLNRVRTVFNVNEYAQAAATAALGDHDFLTRSYELNRAELARVQDTFEDMGLRYVASVANFVLVEVGDAEPVYTALLHDGVIVRPMGMYDLGSWLRVTIGLPEENNRFLGALARALAR